MTCTSLRMNCAVLSPGVRHQHLGGLALPTKSFVFLLKYPGNPLLQLYNLCFHRGYVPRAWTTSTVVPIPKPGTDRFRSISLPSCFCKVLERMLLTRLMFQLQDKLSPFLYSFLPQKSTHHCLTDLYSRLSYASVVAVLDLKSAFDIAN